MSLTFQEMQESGLLDALVDSFDKEEPSRTLLVSIKYPRGQIPTFQTASEFWRMVCQDIDDGEFRDGFGLWFLCKEARRLKPKNKKINDWWNEQQAKTERPNLAEPQNGIMTCYIVIAEDEPRWSLRISNAFDAFFENSILIKRKEVLHKIVVTTSLQAFGEKVKALLSDGYPVYATLDLKMKRKESDDNAEDVSDELLNMCFGFKSNESHYNKFDFCLISGSDRLIAKQNRKRKLKERDVNQVFKNKILDEDDGGEQLNKVARDIKSFILKNITYCTFQNERKLKRLIWFGNRTEIIDRACKIANGEGGIYLIFSDDAGYEQDWYRFICHLREERPRFLDISADGYPADWEKFIEFPPQALLVEGIERIDDEEIDLAGAIKKFSFFQKVKENDAIVFMQFPFGESELAIKRSLNEREMAVLEVCLDEVYQDEIYHGKDPWSSDADFPLLDNKNVIKFPRFERLKRDGYVKSTIDTVVRDSVHQSARVKFDPELYHMLSELPWGEIGGFCKLQKVVQKLAISEKSVVKLEQAKKDIKDLIPKDFERTKALTLRGQLIYSYLEKNRQSESWALNLADERIGKPEEPIEELLTILDLFERLDSLLGDGSTGIPTNERFTIAKYQALDSARRFLILVFDSSKNLRNKILQFKTFAKQPNWEEYYPNLRRVHPDWQSLMAKGKFTWPFSKLPLHYSIYKYLERSHVITEIHTDIDKVMVRHPDLKEKWARLSRQQSRISEELQGREEQRRASLNQLESNCFQPAVTFLSLKNAALGKAFQSLLFFNASIAISESLEHAETSLQQFSSICNFLNCASTKNSILVLQDYLMVLDGPKCHEIREQSVFSSWLGNWAEIGQQDDVLRLLKCIAEAICSKSNVNFYRREQQVLDNMISLNGDCSIHEFLSLLDILERSLIENEEMVADMLRRFITAISRSCFYLVRVTRDGSLREHWSPKGWKVVDESQSTTLMTDGIFVTDENFKVLFTVDELIQVSPGGSIWCHHNNGEWVNLTQNHSDHTRAKPCPEAGHPFLPKFKDLKQTKTWRTFHDT